MFNKYFIALMICSVVLSSCGARDTDEEEQLVDKNDTIKSSVLNVGGELFSVPSPMQTAMLIQKTGIAYDKNVLNNASKVSTFSTDYSRALNLGIFGADLAYVSLYSQTQDALKYLSSIKHLSDKLGISAAFDNETMTRIQKNITNKDSMMVLVGLAYRGSDAYLKDAQRTDISGLILTGGWIESMHFSISAYRTKPTDQVRYRIAEQKTALTSILKILKAGASEESAGLTKSLTELARVYEAIQFKYNFVEPTHDSIKKVTYINSTTEVVVTDEQLTQIIEKIQEIRNNIINTTQS